MGLDQIGICPFVCMTGGAKMVGTAMFRWSSGFPETTRSLSVPRNTSAEGGHCGIDAGANAGGPAGGDGF